MPPMNDDLPVADDFVIPASELGWRFDPSGGPGGQHANKAATRAELTWDVAASRAVHGSRRERLLARLGDSVTVTVDDTRSQWRNRQLARRRMADLLRESMQRPRPRRPTRPTSAARRNRVEAKRRRSETKKGRQQRYD